LHSTKVASFNFGILYCQNIPLGEAPFSITIRPCFQLDSAKVQMFPAQTLLGRCDSCMENFRLSMCDLTCSPVQSNFLKANVIQDMDGTLMHEEQLI
jgi:hypothetical protein